ncbi:MAG: hypothetical protein LBJ64_11215, partial [Deltaproteobacteria bacterium]|nr:hypothetical protein [Deltaproteobacteria bacterium]
MIFFICQIISLLTLSLSLLAGCIAMASAPNLEADYPADGQLRSQVWNLAGWLEPAPKSASARELAAVLTAARPTSGFVRSADAEGGGAVSASAGQGASEKGTAGKSSAGMGLAVSMAFADELSSWPEALAVRCSAGAWGLAAAAGRTVTVLDARPFGRDNIVVIDGADGRPDAGSSGDAEDGAPDGQDLAASLQRCLSELNYYLAAGPVGRSVDWRLLEPGLWRAEVGVFFGPRLGPKEVTLIKASPDHFRFAPYHEAEKDVWKDQPGDARLWARRLPEARVVVNGAQYYPDRSHMGTLRRRGKTLGGREHAVWKGFLVQGPSLPSAAPLMLLDAELTGPARRKQDDYGTVVQSYMVLDSLGRVRVKKSDRLASRA